MEVLGLAKTVPLSLVLVIVAVKVEGEARLWKAELAAWALLERLKKVRREGVEAPLEARETLMHISVSLISTNQYEIMKTTHQGKAQKGAGEEEPEKLG